MRSLDKSEIKVASAKAGYDLTDSELISLKNEFDSLRTKCFEHQKEFVAFESAISRSSFICILQVFLNPNLFNRANVVSSL